MQRHELNAQHMLDLFGEWIYYSGEKVVFLCDITTIILNKYSSILYGENL